MNRLNISNADSPVETFGKCGKLRCFSGVDIGSVPTAQLPDSINHNQHHNVRIPKSVDGDFRL